MTILRRHSRGNDLCRKLLLILREEKQIPVNLFGTGNSIFKKSWNFRRLNFRKWYCHSLFLDTSIGEFCFSEKQFLFLYFTHFILKLKRKLMKMENKQLSCKNCIENYVCGFRSSIHPLLSRNFHSEDQILWALTSLTSRIIIFNIPTKSYFFLLFSKK